MKMLRNYGWLVPVVIFGVLAIATPVSPWLLGGAAVLVIAIMHATIWGVQARRRDNSSSRL